MKRTWHSDAVPTEEVDAPQLVALVRAGARFVNGKVVEREDDQQSDTRPLETAA